MGLHEPSSFVTVIKLVGAAIVVPSFRQDEDVLATTEWIGIHGDRAKVDIGIVAGSLAARRSIEVPFRKLIDALGGFVKGL